MERALKRRAGAPFDSGLIESRLALFGWRVLASALQYAPSLSTLARFAMPLDPVRTLSELVAIPSVNPMGRALAGPEFFEYKVTEYLERLFQSRGWAWRRQTIEPLRDNIVARIEGDPAPEKGGRIIMLEAHQDTVPVDGMTIPPWTPTIDNGRIYGRGACDIKGGMAAMLAAASRLDEEKPAGRPTILLACTVNEEHGYSGASELGEFWSGPKPFVPRAPDAAIIAEPTLRQVVVAHKGACRWRCHARGRAAHSSQPQRGENAIFTMARVLRALESFAREVAPKIPAHRLCGPATLSVGTIQGGISVNTVPDHCVIEIDRRVLPGEKSDEAYRQVVDYVTRQVGEGVQVEHEPPYLLGIPLDDLHNGELAAELSKVAQETCGAGQIIGVPFGTDAAKIAPLGVPSVVFGPGSIDQAHTADEWLSLDELRQATETIYRYLVGVSRRG